MEVEGSKVLTAYEEKDVSARIPTLTNLCILLHNFLICAVCLPRFRAEHSCEHLCLYRTLFKTCRYTLLLLSDSFLSRARHEYYGLRINHSASIGIMRVVLFTYVTDHSLWHLGGLSQSARLDVIRKARKASTIEHN